MLLLQELQAVQDLIDTGLTRTWPMFVVACQVSLQSVSASDM